MSFQNKYLKYKNKYINLKNLLNQKGGAYYYNYDSDHEDEDVDEPVNEPVNEPEDTDINSRLLQTLELRQPPTSLAIYGIPGDYRIVSGTYNHLLNIYDLSTGKLLKNLIDSEDDPTYQYNSHNYDVYSVSVYGTPDDYYIISYSYSIDKPCVKIWNLTTGVCIQRFRIKNDLSKIPAYGIPGDYRIIICTDDVMNIWNPITGERIRSLNGHGNVVSSYGTHGNYYIVSSGYDKTIKIWNENNGDCIQTIREYTGNILTLSYYKIDENYHIISGSSDGTIKIWNPIDGVCLHTLTGNKEPVSSVTIYGPPTDYHIVSTSRIITSYNGDHSYSSIKTWNIRTGECLQTFGHRNMKVIATHETPDEGCLIISSDYGRNINIWHTKTEQELCNWYQERYEEILYEDYSVLIPQALQPFYPALQYILEKVRSKAKILSTIKLLRHKNVWVGEHEYDIAETLMKEYDSLGALKKK